MKTTTLVGTLLGGAVLGVAGYAAASKGKPSGTSPEEPFFLYTMQSGDTLSALALKFFGDGEKWPALLDGTPPEDFRVETLPPGTLLRVPCLWTKVEKGESLAAVAKRTLGDAGRWRRIYEANRKALPDPNKLAVGQRLAVPCEKPPPAAVGMRTLELLGAEYLP